MSNLSFISKIIEKCMLLQLSDHCDTYGLQPDYQSAYREHYSCETAILKLSNDILWAMEKQCITCLVALDLSAAFDTVDHPTLLAILNTKFGLEDKALQWFDQYLRTQILQSYNKWQIQLRQRLNSKCTTRQLCRSKYFQSVLLPTPWSDTKRLTVKWLCRWPQCTEILQSL